MSSPPAPRRDDREFQELIARFDPAVRELALEARALVLDVMPRAVELVWPRQGSASWGTGPRKTSQHFCYVGLFAQHVRFGLYYATELPDPEHLLADGGGKLMRSMRVTDVAQLRQPALRTLLEASTTHRVPPLPEQEG